MKYIKRILFATITGLALTACGDDFFDTENAGVASQEEIDEIGNSSPDALINVVEPLMLGLNNYTYEYKLKEIFESSEEDFLCEFALDEKYLSSVYCENTNQLLSLDFYYN